MSTRKILKNNLAPVVYTLAQVQFSPILKMAQYMGEIQEALAPVLPFLEEKQELGVRININPDGVPESEKTHHTAWQFMSLDRCKSLYLRNDAFVFHSSQYKDFEEFLATVMGMLNTVNRIVPIHAVIRYGLRYVDILQSNEGFHPTHHIAPGLCGLDSNALASVQGLDRIETLQPKCVQRTNENVFHTNYGTLVLRMYETLGTPALPPDLAATTVNVKLTLPQPDQDKYFVTMDIDHFRDGLSVAFSMEAAQNAMRDLHIGTSAVFFAAIKDESINTWSE